MFRCCREAVCEYRKQWSPPNVMIYPACARLPDISYLEVADIYVDDVSNQVYECVIRPCSSMFFDAHRPRWSNDRSFAHWHLGDVIKEPTELMAAIHAGAARDGLYRDQQEVMAYASFGDASSGAAVRAADAVTTFLQR